jgi:hypothetical protein
VLPSDELEILIMLVIIIMLLASVTPNAQSIAIFSEWFWHSLDLPIHEELKGGKVQDALVQATEAVCIYKRRSCIP